MTAHNLPLISVVTVCYNSAPTIEETVLSVLNQTYKNIEYVMIDGGSKDNTLNILTKYKDRLGYFVSEPDKGIYDAMNKALQVASGDWLYFLGSDDVLIDNNVIEEMVAQFKDMSTIYYGNVIFKNENVVYDFNLNKWNLCYRNISHQSLFYTKESYKNHSYDTSFIIFADHIYNISLYGSKKYNFDHIDKVVALYNDAGASSNTYDKKYYQKLPATVFANLGLQYALYVQFRILVFKLKNSLKRFEN